MAQEEDQHTLRAKFYAAVKVICSLPNEGPFQLSDDMMLMFFSYYMQATSGPCSYARPFGFWESQEQAKWDAWSSLGNMTKEDAMKHYVENIQLILETMPVSNEVAELVQKLGNFYTDVVEDEGERDEMDSRLFTRPFAQQADELVTPRKPAMEGYGDLWNDIQDVQEKDSVQSVSFNPVEDANEYLGEEDIHEENETDNDEDKSDVKDQKYIKKHYPPADSDQEEFCDSNEHVTMDKTLPTSAIQSTVSPAASVREQELWFESSSALKAEGGSLLRRESRVQEPHNATFIRESPMTACNSLLLLPACDGVSPCAHRTALPPAFDGVSPCARSSGASWGNVNEQIAAALFRLQDDMAHVLHRLHTLEELSVAQVKESRSSSLRCEDSLPAAHKFSLQFRKPSWWPFDHSPVTVVMTALWPAIAYGLVQLYSRRKRRKMT
ncbi:acyl-CoA-binding domain-containing protein 5-like isoform X3 [Entelurus aequoreus]|uniref:acyl-CoA-binding domain-containing protein 5-like isoform X3 n=1 Tax=Entelurus aequoreus TaxID=161455 RepID=UPI002B1D3236|nr:acyl-CoA-binding domain-containing protein 5-like isoform X3 [Entelurus aequoreus]